MARIPILYQDEHYVAVDKPAGMLVHRRGMPGEGIPVLQRVRDRLGRHVFPVHRLDRPTSGVLVFALDPESAARLCAAFESRAVEKRYLAIVRGYTEESGIIDYALREEPHMPLQPAVTCYRRLATVELPIAVGRYASARYSLVEAVPETGRYHQLRKHFKHIFHPLVGDTTHGEGRHNRLFRTEFGIDRLLLAATDLTFTHPFSGEPLHLRAPLPPEFTQLFQQFGWPPV